MSADVTLNAFGHHLKELRLKQKLSLRAFCETHDLDHGNLSRIERGRGKVPTNETLEKYAVALDLDSDERQYFFDLADAVGVRFPRILRKRKSLPSYQCSFEQCAASLLVMIKSKPSRRSFDNEQIEHPVPFHPS